MRASVGADKQVQINLALQFEHRDEDKAFRWWKRAADGGNGHAEYNVGKRYRDGLGVAKNLELYQEYVVRAALNSNPEPMALLQVGIWLKRGELLDFGKVRNVIAQCAFRLLTLSQTSLLGRTHRDLWDVAVRRFPTTQAGEMCAKELITEYSQELNHEKVLCFVCLVHSDADGLHKRRKSTRRSLVCATFLPRRPPSRNPR